MTRLAPGKTGGETRIATTLGRRLDADLLTPQEIEALLRACSHRAHRDQNRTLLALAWRSGLRIGEVLALRPKDIDFDRGTLRVQHWER